VIHFPGFRLKSTRSLAEGRFPREFFYFFLKSESDISARSFVKSSRLEEESVILYRFGYPVSRTVASSLDSSRRGPIATAVGLSGPHRGAVFDATLRAFSYAFFRWEWRSKSSKTHFDGYEDSFRWGYCGRLIGVGRVIVRLSLCSSNGYEGSVACERLESDRKQQDQPGLL
jgi:hypothetical protein